MGHTNSTANYNLPQFVGSDKPTWLGDVNGAMSAIDAAIANAASAATDAASVATNAATVAAGAVTTANAASATATAASTAAGTATSTANTAADTANNAQSTAVSAYNKALTVGDVTELTTTDKTSAVAAINEVNAALGNKADAATVGDLTDLTTADKTSVVNAINEVVAALPSAGGSVSVTADGVKGTTTLIAELGALVDYTKLNSDSRLIYELTDGNKIVFGMASYSGSGFAFSKAQIAPATTFGIATITYTANAGYYYTCAVTSAAVAFTDRSADVQSAGTKFTVEY